MIRHHVLMSFDEAPDELLDSIVSELRALPASIPQIQTYVVGRDLGVSENAADIAVVAEFESLDDYAAYSAHPAHVAVIEELIKPNVSTLTRAQIDLS